jgi:hypothetical protein
VSSPFNSITKEYEEAFQDFLKALEATDNAPVCFDQPISELTQSYWKFFDRVKTDVKPN